MLSDYCIETRVIKNKENKCGYSIEVLGHRWLPESKTILLQRGCMWYLVLALQLNNYALSTKD